MKFRPMTVLPWCLVAVLVCVAMAPKPQSELVLQSPNGKNTIAMVAGDKKLSFKLHQSHYESKDDTAIELHIDSNGLAGVWLTRGNKEPMVAIYNAPGQGAVVGAYGSKLEPGLSACLSATRDGNIGRLQMVGEGDVVHQFTGDDLAK